MSKVCTTTWAIKTKSNGTFRGRLNARGYEQVDGSHYMADSIAAPVPNPITVHLIFTLLYMSPSWVTVIINVEGVFLQEKCENSKELYLEVWDGFEK